jgi:hypothetical protein
MNGKPRYQQSPPTHIKRGAVYGNEKERRRRERERTEDEAQALILQAALDAVGGDVSRLPPDQLAAYLAMTQRQVRRKVEQLRKRARAAKAP